jgi:hypothetical protein
MTRVREEAIKRNARHGALIGLAATGGVITSADFVLAGTFAVLATSRARSMSSWQWVRRGRNHDEAARNPYRTVCGGREARGHRLLSPARFRHPGDMTRLIIAVLVLA